MVPINRRVRQGSLDIPSACLKTIIDENPTFLSRICKAPCSMALRVVGGPREGTSVTAETGRPIDISVVVELAKWIPRNLLGKTSVTLKFCCARETPSIDSEDPKDPRHPDCIWMGQIRKSLTCDEEASKSDNPAKVLFFRGGEYLVSASITFCATDADRGAKEVWWAEKAVKVRVARSFNRR